MAAIELSWSYDRDDGTYLQIHGQQGSVRIGWQESAFRPLDDPTWTPFGTGYDKIACMRAQVRNFVAAIAGDEPLAVSPGDAIASVQVIDAAYESLAVRDWVAVPSVADARGDRPGSRRHEGVA